MYIRTYIRIEVHVRTYTYVQVYPFIDNNMIWLAIVMPNDFPMKHQYKYFQGLQYVLYIYNICVCLCFQLMDKVNTDTEQAAVIADTTAVSTCT